MSSKITEILTFLGIIAFVVLLSLKLSSQITSWPLVFLPLYIIIGLNTLYMIKYELLLVGHRDYIDKNFDSSLLEGLEVFSPLSKPNKNKESEPEHTPSTNILTAARSVFGRVITWVVFLVLSLEIVLVAAFLSTDSLPLYSIFIIPYISTFIGCAISMYFNSACFCCCATGSVDDDDDSAMTSVITMILSILSSISFF